jgi:inorganic triphosphatase YgiF
MTSLPPLEIELKLALPPQQAEAFLKRMARRRAEPVCQVLHTRYFDTPDFDLSAQGVALRVRRVGRRWLQTLKTEGERQGGLSCRAEYEMPVGRGMPDWTRFPPEALARVPDALRERIVPVFETNFQRTTWLVGGRGGAQIEVALDVGEVRTLLGINQDERSQPICEIELELKAGQPDALFALALEWAAVFDCLPFDVSKAERGVRLAHGMDAAPVTAAPLRLDAGLSVEAGFAAMVQACLAQFQANLPGVQTSDAIEYVHQARVALRRLRAVLRLYRRVCLLPDELMAGLRVLAAALGPVRDWDVLCAETLPAIAPYYADSTAWQSGMLRLEAHRAGVRAAMRDALKQAHAGAWLLAMQRWLLQRGWRSHPDGHMYPSGGVVPEAQRLLQLSPLDAWARQALSKGHRAIVRGARGFAGLAPLQRHALRIDIKRQRYAAEFFQPLFGDHGRRQARYLRALRNAQDSLGRANDAHNAWTLLATAGVAAGPMGDFALGWLAACQAEAERAEKPRPIRACQKLAPYW